MRNKTKWIIGGILSFAVILFGCLYFIPKSTPIDITLDAVKYKDGSSLDASEPGTVQIHIHGTLKEYLFRENTLTFAVDDFDHLYDIHAWDSRYEGSCYVTKTLIEDAEILFGSVFEASSTVTGEDTLTLSVAFQPDLKEWILSVGYSVLHPELEDHPVTDNTYRATIE